MMNKKLIYKIHKYTGLTLGFVVFLLALSGVGITFRHELLPFVYSDLFTIPKGNSPLPLNELTLKAYQFLGDEKNLTNLYASEDKDEAYLLIYKDSAKTFPVMMTMNPYTGEVIGQMPMIKNFFAVMLFMHSNLFLGKAGKYFVGIMGFILIFFVLSGLYIWLPQSKVVIKLKRTVQLTRAHLTQRLHHSLGLILALPLLLSALTGSLIIFDLSYLVMRPLRGEPHKIEEAIRPGSCTFAEQMEALKMATPLMSQNLISVHYCTPKNALMKISYGLHNQNFLDGYERVIIDPKTKNIIQTFNSEKDPSSWNSLRLTIYPLHTGEYLGLGGRVFVLLSGIGLMMIYLTGVILYFKRRVRQNVASTF